MIPTNREPTPPGRHLERFIEGQGLTQQKLHEKTGIGLQTINLIINGKRAVTAETALLLTKVFDITPQFWLNAQATHDLWKAQRELKAEGRL